MITGLVNWAARAVILGAVLGLAGGGSGGGGVPGIGGIGRGGEDLWAGLKEPPNHPDRLLVGGLLGPRRGGEGASNGLGPGGDSAPERVFFNVGVASYFSCQRLYVA